MYKQLCIIDIGLIRSGERYMYELHIRNMFLEWFDGLPYQFDMRSRL
jgi:hypothetical protein